MAAHRRNGTWRRRRNKSRYCRGGKAPIQNSEWRSRDQKKNRNNVKGELARGTVALFSILLCFISPFFASV